MGADYVINGETLVRVKGNGALADPQDTSSPKLWTLGLAAGPVIVSPRFYHKDVHVDDFGPDVPAEVIWQLADVLVDMTLVYYDPTVLERALVESMGGQATANQTTPGVLAGAGGLMGRGLAPLAAGNHYISLNLLSPVLNFPWRFPTSYVTGQPLILPLGVRRTEARVVWRAIPYRRPTPSTGSVTKGTTWDVRSAQTTLWDRTLDD